MRAEGTDVVERGEFICRHRGVGRRLRVAGPRRDLLRTQDPTELPVQAGRSESLLERSTYLLAGAGTSLSFICMGLNQSTVDWWKIYRLINLHLLTDQIGKPGTGPFPSTSQPNASGGRTEDGTRTSCEHTVSYSPALLAPPSEVLPDGQILTRRKRTLGLSGYGVASAIEVWDEIVGCTPGRPCARAGATSARLRTAARPDKPARKCGAVNLEKAPTSPCRQATQRNGKPTAVSSAAGAPMSAAVPLCRPSLAGQPC